MSEQAVIVWFRQDLRLDDHAALSAAAATGQPVIPLFIWDATADVPWAPGAAARWWLHQSLYMLDQSLRRLGSRLILRQGDERKELADLIAQAHVVEVHAHEMAEPTAQARDAQVMAALKKLGAKVTLHPGNLLFAPKEVRTGAGGPYQVFTPYYEKCLSLPAPGWPTEAVRTLRAPRSWPASVALKDLGLEPEIPWTQHMAEFWRPGEEGARRRLETFIAGALGDYVLGRERMDAVGTSLLSPHLHWGELSVRRLWHEVAKTEGTRNQGNRGGRGIPGVAGPYLRQLVWREFAHHLLHHFPDTPTQPLRKAYAGFPWRRDETALRAWRRGRTGYPIVDAGMRQLWALGWMHNRARMIVGSFLVKDLLLSWQEGARWFWDTLVDADLANNTLGWQWVAGCGADAAPYFRIFNPVTQGQRYDPNGEYVRRWVPELARLPAKWIHCPWNAPDGVLKEAGVKLGESYPQPIVDHAAARERALDALARIKALPGAGR